MKTVLIALALLLLGLVVLGVLLKRQQKENGNFGKEKNGEKPRACAPLTRHEQAMFFRLQTALPELVVLSQVSFGALLTAKARSVRNTFDRKRADFVVCNPSFNVLAVIELDDNSHIGREENDQDRDKLLTDAGYRVLRYRSMPEVEQIAKDFKPKQGPINAP
ncbi:MAG: DUF2726 domain-containing protein [Burkholderiaceae bacterium]|nr:DUF2726 domain-containing protein [Burkholderiaceae bacterium]